MKFPLKRARLLVVVSNLIDYSLTMNVVILAAGIGSRFGEVTTNIPKCMLKMGDQHILEMQLEALSSLENIEKIYIITGYQHKLVSNFIYNSKFRDKVHLVFNEDFESTNNMYSLSLAEEHVRGKSFILCNGDVVFTSKSILRFSELDRSEILVDQEQFRSDSMKVVFDSSNLLMNISKNLIKESSSGISLDIYKFSREDSQKMFEFIKKEIGEGGKNSWTELAIAELSIRQEIKMHKLEIGDDLWFEIDNKEDLQLARNIFFPRRDFFQFQYYFFDLDGTLMIENNPIQGSLELIHKLQSLNKAIFFLTNNSGYSDSQHFKRLVENGFRVNQKQVISSLGQSLKYLLTNEIKEIFFMGTAEANHDLQRVGIITDSKTPKIVLIGNDTEITYQKLSRALELIYSGVPYFLTHSDFSRPTNIGLLPDVGSWALLIEKLTGLGPARIFGKPDVGILDVGLETPSLDLSAVISFDTAVIVGDRLDSDIALGFNADISSVLTLSGVTSEKIFQESSFKPNMVVESVSEFLDLAP
jgi:HAD superfamily hydrolase (TIGR01450 family)